MMLWTFYTIKNLEIAHPKHTHCDVRINLNEVITYGIDDGEFKPHTK